MSADGFARRILAQVCDVNFAGFGVVMSFTLPDRHAKARERDHSLCLGVTHDVVTHLQNGGTRASAMELVENAKIPHSIVVCEGYWAIREAVVARFAAGDNIPDAGETGGVVVVRTWYDRTHQRVY